MIPHVYWTYFTKYHELADAVGMRGAVYGWVVNETMPKSTDCPSDFEECLYIGQSGGADGYYFDVQNGIKGKLRTDLHKRMTAHHKPLTTGKTTERKYLNIIETYGCGEDVLNGTHTGRPFWVGFICPPKEDPNLCVKSWLISREHYELYQYQRKFDKTPMSNLQVSPKERNPNTKSAESLGTFNALEAFMHD